MSLPAAGRIESPLRPNISVAYLRYCSANVLWFKLPQVKGLYFFTLSVSSTLKCSFFWPQTVVVIAYIVQGSAAEVRFISI